MSNPGLGITRIRYNGYILSHWASLRLQVTKHITISIYLGAL